MRKPSGSLFIAAVVYVIALIPVTLVAVILFERQSNFMVVPVEYLLPLWPAAVAYRWGRAAQ